MQELAGWMIGKLSDVVQIKGFRPERNCRYKLDWVHYFFFACMSGSCMGFIVHNRNPATVFMGDTGSLALGGALAAVGLLSQNLWGLFILSGIFFVESVSVIAQVSYYKATKDRNGIGKRLFKMSPFHNHLELTGWSETQIVGVFYIVNAVLVLLCFATKGSL